MTGTPALREDRAKEPEMRAGGPPRLTLGKAVLWMIAIAGGWTILLVLFHNLMDRLLY